MGRVFALHVEKAQNFEEFTPPDTGRNALEKPLGRSRVLASVVKEAMPLSRTLSRNAPTPTGVAKMLVSAGKTGVLPNIRNIIGRWAARIGPVWLSTFGGNRAAHERV